MGRRAVLLIAHGSREAASNRAFLDLAKRLQKTSRLCSVVGCFLELARPDIAGGIEECVRRGAREITVIPLMLFPGRHVAKDIPRLVRETARRHPGVRFRLKPALALHPKFLTFVKEIL